MERSIKTVAIIGVGTIGTQIAIRIGNYNYNLKLYDANSSTKINIEKTVKKIARTKEKEKIGGEVSYCDSLQKAVSDADLILESIPENLQLKSDVFAQIDAFAPSHAILATNSSSYPVSKMESMVKRKDKVLNIHFYSPAYQRNMADIMRGTQTSDETFQTGLAWIKSIGCLPLVVKKECMGFVFNRIWHAIKKECLKIWAGGYADIETVDEAWKIFSGMGLGPFKMMDGVGLDVVYDIEMAYYNENGDPNDKPPQALKEMVERGQLGGKTGNGFYSMKKE